ncbi:permease-like cell division protein FtsX [Salsipaludibacter albus]|uniref:permease-like cell division protein FtsX n=1 Tax=Salsipaludibacter albus TaxID=2849650 RepID=UPI001EE453CE|nr:permease-like cell division protein FtsX [Salsipaludibacter albus]MBY5162800.1 permease-like cell division protein FtsX [Salsipaludibacter albus]
MRRWSYILNEAAIGLRRNLWMTVAVVLSVTVSLALFGASVLLRQQVDAATDDWTGKIEVSIYLCDGLSCPPITDSQQDELLTDLEGNPLVDQVFYETKEEAYQAFQEQFANEPTFLESVDETTLPASFRVKLTDPERFDAIQTEYENRPGVESIVDQKELLDEFLAFTSTIRWSALFVAAIQMLAATVLVANTVRMAAFARRDQTQIMKLVGASNWYVRLPFILEGVLAGLIGAAVSWGILVVFVPWMFTTLQESLTFVPFLTRAQIAGIWPWLAGPAVVMTGGSSIVALWGFLDV